MAFKAAQLFVDTVEALSSRAPAIVAAAAHQLGAVTLSLHFGDGSHALLRAEHSRLIARPERLASADVEAYFDRRAMNLLFDLARRPVDELLPGSLDVRGGRDNTLAVWRTFRLLAQRASGLRLVQALWREYRDQSPELWGAPAVQPEPNGDSPAFPPPRHTRWRALDFLDGRLPADGLTPDEDESLIGGTLQVRGRVLWDNRRSSSWWQTEAAPSPSSATPAPPTSEATALDGASAAAPGADAEPGTHAAQARAFTGNGMSDADLLETMERCKRRVHEELDLIVPRRDPAPYLYELMREYPSRGGKGLRPTLTLAACAAFGGASEDAVRAAAAVELFHNGFLIHDDIADESTHRRLRQTLHELSGPGLAVNTGDAMNLLAVDTVLSNLDTLGLARTLALIHEIMHMCRETLEGQALELGWIRDGIVPPRDEDYFHMSTKKTGWYTVISPCRLGAICAGETDPAVLDRLNETFRLVGIAFQIQDDLLNLIGDTDLYGKEPLGDLLEGKRTVMLIHLFRKAGPRMRRRLLEIIRLPRREKKQEQAEELLRAMHEMGSLDYAIALADELAHEGVRRFETDLAFLPESEAKGVLRQVANYVTTRHL